MRIVSRFKNNFTARVKYVNRNAFSGYVKRKQF